MDTARIRKAFRYPEAEDEEPTDASTEEYLDEQEQEELIASIARKDALNTVIYGYIFSALPIICALTYLPIIIGRGSTVRTFCNACFCVTSLCCSAWIMFNPTTSDHAQERSWQNKRRLTDQLLDPSLSKWYLPIVNGTLGFVLAFQSLVSRRPEELWPPGWLPFVLFGLIMLAKRWMTPVDVEELNKSRYRYKGA